MRSTTHGVPAIAGRRPRSWASSGSPPCLARCPWPTAIARCREVLERERDNRVVEPAISRYLAVLEARLGRFDEARTLAARTVELYDELGMRLFAQAASAMARGDIELLAGDFVAAEEVLRPGLDALERDGRPGLPVERRGFSRDALSSARDGSTRRRRWRGAPKQPRHRTTSGRRRCHAGRAPRYSRAAATFADAEQLGRETVAVLQDTDALELKAVALLDLAEVFVYAGGSREAAFSAEQALSLYEQKGNVVAAERARSSSVGSRSVATTMAKPSRSSIVTSAGRDGSGGT